MRNRLLIGILAAALLAGATLAARAEDALARVRAAGVLKVGTETSFVPFDFMDTGAHVGLNVDIFNEIGKDLGVKITWVTLTWPGVLPGLEAGRFDVVAGPATVTRDRMARYRFTVPIAESSVAILKGARDGTLTTPADIAGKAIGAGTESASIDQLRAFAATLPTPVDVREYTSATEAYADLEAGRIAGVANAYPDLAYIAKERPGVFAVVQPPFGQKTYFAYPGLADEDHKALMDAIDTALRRMKSDGRLAKLQQKWFGVSFDTPDAVTDPGL